MEMALGIFGFVLRFNLAMRVMQQLLRLLSAAHAAASRPVPPALPLCHWLTLCRPVGLLGVWGEQVMEPFPGQAGAGICFIALPLAAGRIRDVFITVKLKAEPNGDELVVLINRCDAGKREAHSWAHNLCRVSVGASCLNLRVPSVKFQ